MIHYFNPGHEIAVLNASKHYHQPANIKKLQTDLAFLPAWYANSGDFVFLENFLPDDFLLFRKGISKNINPVYISDLEENREIFRYSEIDLWGISPQSINFFDIINKRLKISLKIPQWTEELRFLGSRFASNKILVELINQMQGIDPEILPHFFSTLESIERLTVQSQDVLIVKSPFSSSGRGLVWLAPGKINKSEKQIILGMLKKQKQISVEKALEKSLDFSMQFENTIHGCTKFIGYSIFETNSRGSYQKSWVAGQEFLERKITNYIDKDLLLQTKHTVSELIRKLYLPYYKGIMGVDMMVYKSDNHYYLHPCVEINMRNNMGNLAISLHEKYLYPDSQGWFYINYSNSPLNIINNHKQMQKKYPLIIENGRIRSGYLNLCPISDSTNYHSFLI